jgi:hypothetical protein
MSEYPLYKKTLSDTAVYHGATKSASDGRHGSPRRTVHIPLDKGGDSGGVGIGDCLKVPA